MPQFTGTHTDAGGTPPDLATQLRAQQRGGWERGEPVPVEQLLVEHPEIVDDPDCVIDLIYHEYLLEEQFGDRPELDAFVARFPQHAAALRMQIAFHRAVADAPEDPVSPQRTREGQPDVRTTEGPENAIVPAFRGYEVLEEIGFGGAGVVYRARQLETNRIVALKVLSAGIHAGAVQRARFRAEAELIARLQHPNIVQIYEAGEHDGCPYLVLEFIGGGSLRDRLQGVPQPPRAASRFLEEIARALQAAHAAGIVHRDLTPGNVLFTGDARERETRPGIDVGQPKISDFGLAKSLGADAASESGHRTMTGDVIGTPAYMSPEQARGETGAIGPATDIYSLGAILYELLTGRPPHRGVTTVETLQRVVSSEPVTPSRLQPGLDADLETICLKCLQKLPPQRYASAADLAEDLRRYLAGEPIVARPISVPVKLARWCRRKPLLAGLLSLVGLLLVVVVTGSITAAVRLNQAARDRLAEAKLAEARVHRLDSQFGRSEKSLAALAETARIHETAEVRDEAIASLALFDMKFHHEGPPAAGLIDISADLKFYACHLEPSGAVSIRHVLDNAEICRLTFARRPAGGLFSPDGSHVVFSWPEGPHIEVWSVAGSIPRLVVADDRDVYWGMGAVNFSGDGRHFAIGRPDRTVHIYRLEDGARVLEVHVPAPIRHLAFRPNLPHLAVVLGASLQIRDIRDGRLLIQLDEALACEYVSWHPQGRFLVTSDPFGGLSLWEPDHLRRVYVLPGRASGGVATAFDRSGTLLFSTGRDGSLRVWDPHWGRPLLNTIGSSTYHLRFSTDGRYWMGDVENGRVRVWEFPEAPAYRRLASTTEFDVGPIRTIAVRPAGADQKRLFAVAAEKGVGFWDVDTGRPVAQMPVGSIVDLAFDDSGNLLTADAYHVQFWPIRVSASAPDVLTVGPPEKIARFDMTTQMACSADGRVIGLARSTRGGMLIDRERQQPPVVVAPQANVLSIAVTRDGRMAATGRGGDRPGQIWDARRGELLQEIPFQIFPIAFSPDGKRLLASRNGLELWSVGDWNQLWDLPDPSPLARAFSPDGQFIALGMLNGQIVVRSAADGRIVARLEDANPSVLKSLAYAPDGRSLVGLATDWRQLSIWNLASLGKNLEVIGVHCELTEFSPQVPVSRREPPSLEFRLRDSRAEAEIELVRIRRDLETQPQNVALLHQLGTRLAALGRDDEARHAFAQAVEVGAPFVVSFDLGTCEIRLGHWREGVAVFERALTGPELTPTQSAALCNQVAWYLNLAPPDFRNPPKALEYAHRALEFDPEGLRFLGILGTALYRQGQLPLAIETLRLSQRNSAMPVFDLYVLALCHQATGNHARAAEFASRADYQFELQEQTLEPQRRVELQGLREEYLRGLPSSSE
jgi:serine/threonine protein kinase/WD40 repeat protein